MPVMKTLTYATLVISALAVAQFAPSFLVAASPSSDDATSVKANGVEIAPNPARAKWRKKYARTSQRFPFPDDNLSSKDRELLGRTPSLIRVFPARAPYLAPVVITLDFPGVTVFLKASGPG